ncbi:phospho-sugar mutase [Paenibacillus alvei]|uniref:phosphoglucomutase (alpha-D-glucose-1,6-bisphosphate-dependent) n=1 Tax=Paenibacillus alvei TaxID=44250 RepID=A0ABT4GXZ5_PAEAL|nr:phospho-sugar mutase [Paenibacillus alvei]MCY9540730.1 phospho-sugar mutase [Paenibacillus alvei]MCY9703007.1 phospho-sugar mutase [Paenibacillus alvei]MCY9734588.1 phospho-sugar mutase [Paenibacillus alvei]MCY9757618.1 phospho-sugar mutase [Paenibacillus alvei]
MRAQQAYDVWLNDAHIDEATKAELQQIAGNEREITDRFYKDLEFGTGGLRGVIGAGSNRMNVYTVGKATQGLAQFLKAEEDAPSVAIAYDSRHFSPEFALEAALVLAGNGVKAYVFESLRPTPELSFAVRNLKASAGIVVTASHNPPEYNGYKVYGNDGGQITPHTASRVIAEIRGIESFANIQKLSREEAEAQGLLVWLGQEMDEAYISAVASVSQNEDIIRASSDSFRVLYTPLHGTGNKPVRAVLDRIGFQQVRVVAEQELPDGSFPTVKSPNPEEREAFSIAIEQAKAWDADIIMGTDPDADRMGAVVKDAAGEYVVLTGNQSGAIMVHYLLDAMKSKGTLPANGAVIKTIVTSELGAAIAKSFGMTVFNTLTGFKYIGEKMTEFDRTGEHAFIFGYEESYGYLAGNYARDKDAVIAAMLICEAGAYYKAQGKTLYGVLQELYAQHGYYLEGLQTRTLKGVEGVAIIQGIMNNWREETPTTAGGASITLTEDFAQGLYDLPKENVLKFHLEDGSWFCLRPSGTEPKIKMYFAVKGSSSTDAADRLQRVSEDVMSRIDAFIEAQS